MKEKINTELLLAVSSVARRLGLSTMTIYRKLELGVFTPIIIDGSMFIHNREVEKYIESQEDR